MNFFKNLFFRRMKRLQGEERDYYIYDLPEDVRNQIVHIVLEHMTSLSECDEFARKFAKELGRLVLYDYKPSSTEISVGYGYGCERIELFIKNEQTELVLSLIEYFLFFKLTKQDYSRLKIIIEELNRMFEVNKIGYEIVPVALENDLPFIVVPIYSKFLYIETIKKPLTLLYDCEFKGALSEFEEALDFLRECKYDQAIVEANKSFESTLKAIMDKLGIEYEKGDTVRKLVQRLFDSERFIDPSLKGAFNDAFNKVINILQAGLPTLRNQAGVAHGSGLDPKNLEKSYAKLAIHLAGAYIVFLIDRFKEAREKQ